MAHRHTPFIWEHRGSRRPWCMPHRSSTAQSQPSATLQLPSLFPTLVLFGLFGSTGLSVKLWCSSLCDALAFGLLSTAVAFILLVGTLLFFLHLEQRHQEQRAATMAGGKTAPKPESRAVRFRSVAAVVLVLSALAFTWQNMSLRSLFGSDPVPPAESVPQPPVQPPSSSSSWLDKLISPVGQVGLAAVALGVLVLSTGTASRPKRKQEIKKKGL